MSDAILKRDRHETRKTAAATVAGGEIHQLADGRAGVLNQLDDIASGDRGTWVTEGTFTVTKTSGEVWVDGQPIYWDHSANSATCLTPTSDKDFYLGVAVGDATSAATTGLVNLNVRGEYVIDLKSGVWTPEATNGLGTTLLPGGGVQLAFDAVTEAAQAAIYSERTVPISANWILEARVAIFDKGDNAALDFDLGLANGSHATDFEAITEFVAVHFDGNTLDIDTHSDDGTTDVAPDDTDFDATDDTYFDIVIDGRDPSDIQIYINGDLVNGSVTFTLGAATGPLKAIVHMEKTSDDTVADVRVDFLRVRIAEQ